jgi:hypothetical protein
MSTGPQDAHFPVGTSSTPNRSKYFLEWLERWRPLWEALQGAASIMALTVSIGALVASIYGVKYVVQQAAMHQADLQFQLEQAAQGAKDKDAAFSLERSRFQHAQTARQVEDVNKITLLLAEHPEIGIYFERSLADDPLETPADRDRRLIESFNTANKDVRLRVHLACEMIADFMDSAFLQRDSLSPDDWNRWWNYFMDSFDENPLLRNHLKSRADWYRVAEVLPNRAERAQYYVGTESRRPNDHVSFK